jgi:hypothetical protein
MAKELPQHQDRLGQDLNLDDCVAFPVSNSLYIGKVTKLNNKMVKVCKVPSGKYASEWNKYPADLVKLDSSTVTLYLLKTSA